MTLDADLRWLVGHESPSDDAGRVSDLARGIVMRLARSGASARGIPCAGAGDAVRATLGAGESGGTLLLGHLDTVWPVGTLRERPFRIENGRATGPGAFDMKAGIAVALALFDEIGRKEPPPRVSLFLAPDEETGSAASRDALVAFAREHDRVLVLEPSHGGGAAKVARKGTGLVEAVFRGRAAHAGLEPEKGSSALLEMARFALFLESVADRAAGTTVTPTVAAAGGKTNVVPDSARLLIDARVWTAAEERRLRAALEAYRSADPGVAVSVDARFDRPPMEETPASRALYDRMRAIARDLGKDLGAERVGGASDGNLTAAAGVPTLDGLGPAGGGAHSQEEWVDLDDLEFRAALLARFLDDAA